MGALPEGFSIRQITDEEVMDYVRAVGAQFGETLEDEVLDAYASMVEVDRAFVCVEGDRIVGTAGNLTFRMGLPGAEPAPCAGLTAVGVHPTRRRRGILRALMQRHLDDAASRGEPFTALYASEASIYPRFGYGPAVPGLDLKVTAPFARFHSPASAVDDLRLIEPDEAVATFPGIQERVQSQTPGTMAVRPQRWDLLRHDPPSWRDGGTARQLLLLPERGYAVYRLKDAWRDGVADGKVRILELIATDPEAYAALWQFCLSIDLFPNVEAAIRPVDEPLPHALVDAARLRMTPTEPMYLRLVDLPACLTARRYAAEGSVVLEVHDATLPANEGRWLLEAGPDGAGCRRTDASPDLTLDTAVLATVLLGGVRLRSLVDARRLDVHDHGKLELLDRMLHTHRAPWNDAMF